MTWERIPEWRLGWMSNPWVVPYLRTGPPKEKRYTSGGSNWEKTGVRIIRRKTEQEGEDDREKEIRKRDKKQDS